MAIQQAVAEALAAVERVQSLVGTSAIPPTPTGTSLAVAAEAVATAGERVSALSSELIDQHRDLLTGASGLLAGNDHADITLYEQLSAAAAATEHARVELDAIAARTRSLTRAAVMARTPADQRAVLQALRAQVSQASSVVESTQRHAGGIAAQIRALNYQPGT
ncbi:hypothetical protein [Mycobacterium intracellulare]|uniref:hypothetical protein n=1 Tax=Mycobacterium intracellulare TaxID=1767 RepID=UPI0006CA727E|nr:hypothetical protein [Mycobacterium intracellulare]